MDQKLLFLINREWTHPVLDRVMALLSSFDAWFWPMIVFVVWILMRGNFRARAFVLVAGLVVGLNDGLVSKSLKRAVDRPRPHQAMNDVRKVDLEKKTKPRLLAVFKPVKEGFSRISLEDVDGRSFPSSHTINMISVALVAVCFYGWRAWWTFLTAGLVGYSRIYTGSHWPSDVVTSIFLGLGCAMLWLAAIEWAWRRWGARLAPGMHSAHPVLYAA